MRTVNGVFCEVCLPYNGHVPNHVYRHVSMHSVNGPYMLEIVKTVVCKMSWAAAGTQVPYAYPANLLPG